jgi:hypothetical protein
MRIDVHAHYWTDAYLDLLVELGKADTATRRGIGAGGGAATPMPHIDASIAEMARAIDELGMVGLTMNTSVLDRAITDAEFEPIFAELDRRAAILYLHPAGNGACSPLVNRHRIT